MTSSSAQHVAPSDQVVTRDLPPLSLRAVFNPRSVNLAKRTVDVVWSTGSKGLRYSWDIGKYYEELSLDPKHVDLTRLNGGGAPLLDTHDSYELAGIIGVVETASTDGKEGTATVRFPKAEDDANADAIFRKVADGIIRNLSVGYMVDTYEKTESASDKIPTYRAIKWTPYEISLVPVGFDAAATVRTLISRSEPAAASRADADRLRLLRLTRARF